MRIKQLTVHSAQTLIKDIYLLMTVDVMIVNFFKLLRGHGRWAIPLDKGLLEEIPSIDSSWGESVHPSLYGSASSFLVLKNVHFPQYRHEMSSDLEIDIALLILVKYARCLVFLDNDKYLCNGESIDYFNPSSSVVSRGLPVVAPQAADTIGTPLSTSIDQDAPSISTLSTTHETQSPILSQVSARKQLQIDAMWGYFYAFLTLVKSKNYKEALLESSWIEAMQEEIHEFELIIEYLVKISKKARILELKQRHLKITVLTSYTSYPSRNIRRICAYTLQETTKNQSPIRLKLMMDDPNITIEEYIKLQAEKAQRRGRMFNWETNTYGKSYCDDLVFFADFEAEYTAIVYNDALTLNENVPSKPHVSIYNAIKADIDFSISFSDSKDEDYTLISDKDSFSYKLIPFNDLKQDPVNDHVEMNTKLCSEDVDIKPMDSVVCISNDITPIEFDKNIETNHDDKSKSSKTKISGRSHYLFTKEVLQPGICVRVPLNNGYSFSISM
ncbi:hypothetical protein Tco_0873256 [Tanacetum coccineum]